MSPYHYPSKIPNPAKNWSASRQKKCIAAANAVLAAGKSEQEAIFACIHNSKTKADGEDDYDRLTQKAASDFQHLVELYFAGKITLAVLRSRFRTNLKDYYLVLLAAAADRELTQEDMDFIDTKLVEQYAYLDAFVSDLEAGQMSQQRALWRAGKYAFPRQVYVAGMVDPAIYALMDNIPGSDCYGDGYCGCWLEVEYDSDGNASVYWMVDPAKESCVVCLNHMAESPYFFTAEELANA